MIWLGARREGLSLQKICRHKIYLYGNGRRCFECGKQDPRSQRIATEGEQHTHTVPLPRARMRGLCENNAQCTLVARRVCMSPCPSEIDMDEPVMHIHRCVLIASVIAFANATTIAGVPFGTLRYHSRLLQSLYPADVSACPHVRYCSQAEPFCGGHARG